MKPVLLIGGYGVTGQKTAEQLRRLHPDVPLAIAGRNLESAQAMADELGNAVAYHADLYGAAPDLGLPHGNFSAMVPFLMDDTGSALEFAGRYGIPYIAVTGGAFELGQQVAMALQVTSKCQVTIAGNWFCGAAIWTILDLCSKLSKVDQVQVGIVIDRNGSESGPAVAVDFDRILRSCATMPERHNAHYRWVTAEESQCEYLGTGGRMLPGKPSVSVDAVSIGAVTDARNVSVLETWGDSLSFLNEGYSSDEIVIEATGTDLDGQQVKLRQEIIASRDGATLTAIAIALLIEKSAGLSGAKTTPGLYFPETALDHGIASKALAAAGVRFSPIERCNVSK